MGCQEYLVNWSYPQKLSQKIKLWLYNKVELSDIVSDITTKPLLAQLEMTFLTGRAITMRK